MNATRNDSHNMPEGDFMRLFVRHEPVLRAYARTILPDWESVDDTIQEASVTMWQKLQQLESESAFLPWAKVIVRYKCLHQIERIRREKPLLTEEVLKMLADEAAQTSIEDFAKMRSALDACLQEFTKPHQELLLAPYRGAVRVKELAQQTGKSANAFYKLSGRLRAKLFHCIDLRVQSEVA